MKLSDFGLCKPLNFENLSCMNAKEPMNESELLDANGCLPDKGDGSSWKSPLEQMQHWQMNRRTLVSQKFHHDIKLWLWNTILGNLS